MEYKIPKALQALTSLPTENEVLPAAFSNVFGVIVLIIPNCYNLPMFPVIPRMLQVTTLVYMLYGAGASYFKSMIPIVDSPVRKSVVENKCYCGSKSSSKCVSKIIDIAQMSLDVENVEISGQLVKTRKNARNALDIN